MAFIANIQSPTTVDELADRLENDGMTCIEIILNGKKKFGVWDVDPDCSPGDIVFFVCAETATEHMSRVSAEAKELGDPKIAAFAERERMLYKSYAGSVMAIGKVAGAPFETTADPHHDHWNNSWHAQVNDFRLLSNPVALTEYQDFIAVKQDEPATKLDDDQARKLLELVVFDNVR